MISSCTCIVDTDVLVPTAHYMSLHMSAFAGVALALLPEQTAFPAVAEDDSNEDELNEDGRWEALVDPGALELQAASCLLQVAGTRIGMTAVGLESSIASGMASGPFACRWPNFRASCECCSALQGISKAPGHLHALPLCQACLCGAVSGLVAMHCAPAGVLQSLD